MYNFWDILFDFMCFSTIRTHDYIIKNLILIHLSNLYVFFLSAVSRIEISKVSGDIRVYNELTHLYIFVEIKA